MSNGSSDDNQKGPVRKAGLRGRATSVGYERGMPHLSKSADDNTQDPDATPIPQAAQFEYSSPDEATRMSTVGLGDSINEGIVIASSSVHKFEANELAPVNNSAERAPKPSQVSVREQERQRLRIIVTYLDTKDIFYPTQGTTLIGRDPSSDLRLLDPKVSRHHARIEASVGGQRIVDIGSGNAIRLNGRKKRAAELFDGDYIQIGDTTLEFQTIGWARERRQQGLESGVLGWIRVFDILGKNDRFRLAVYALSLSFLASGFIFLLMSFLSSTGTTSGEEHILSYRRQAEKRAMDGDLEGALRSLDKVAFMVDELSTTDQRKRRRWKRQLKEQQTYRSIQVQTLGDPTPEELDELMEKLVVDPSIRAAAATQVARAKLSYLDRAVRGQKLSAKESARLQAIYSSIDRKLVNGVRYENVSRRLFRQ